LHWIEIVDKLITQKNSATQ